MTDTEKPRTYIKKKDKPKANIGFRTSDFFRNQAFKPGGLKPGKAGFNPGSFKTQHRG